MKTRSSPLGIFFIALIAFFILVLCILLSLPTFFSTRPGSRFLSKIIENHYKISVAFDELKLTWFGSQEVKGLIATSKEFVLTSPDINSDASLFQIFFHSQIGKTIVSQPSLKIVNPQKTTALFSFPPFLQPFQKSGLITPTLAFSWQNPAIKGTLIVQEGEISILTPHTDPIFFKQIDGNLHIVKTREISVALTAVTEQLGKKGSISVQGTLTPSTTHLTTRLSNLPVQGIDQILSVFTPRFSGLLLPLFGPSLTIASDFTLAEGNASLNLTANSENFNAQITTNSQERAITLTKPGTINFTLTQEALQKLGILFPALKTVSLAQPISFTSNLSQLFIPLPLDISKALFSLQMQNSAATGILLNGKPLQINQLSLIAARNKLAEGIALTVKTNVQNNAAQMGTINASALLQSDFTGTASFDLFQFPTDLLAYVTGEGASWSPFIGASITTKGTIELGKEQQKLQASVQTEKFQIPSLFGTYSPSKNNGSLSMKQLLFTGPQKIALENVNLPFQRAQVSLSAQITQDSLSSGTIKADATFAPKTLKANVDLNQVPSVLLEIFLGQPGFSDLVGPQFSSQLTLTSASEKQAVGINWTSPLLTLNAGLSISDTCIQIQGAKNQAQWTVTPKSYLALDRLMTLQKNATSPFELTENTTFSLAIDQFSLPLLPNKNLSVSERIQFDPSAIKLNISAKNPKLIFLDKIAKESIELTALNASISKLKPDAPLSLSLDTAVVTKSAQGQASKSGTIALKGSFLRSDDVSMSLKMQQFPASILDLAARTKGRTDFPFSTLFGQTLDATLSMDFKQLTGPFQFTISSYNTRASLQGTLTKGILKLDQTAHAQIKITPEISRLLLKEINPLDLSYFYSKDPITVQIRPENFNFPVYPFDKNQIDISAMTIELGKVTSRNEGNVNITLGLLKSKSLTKNQDLELWFAPIDLSIKKGMIDIERTEILLANTYDIAVWGNIDLPKDYLSMQLGLTANTLQKAFGIKNLPENYVLSIPMRGPMNNVKIDTSKATTKVGLLLAWQQADKTGAFGKAGPLVGGLLGKIATLPDSNAKIPPAKHPFPWEIGEKKKKTSHRSEEKMRRFKQNEKPLKQLLKVIR